MPKKRPCEISCQGLSMSPNSCAHMCFRIRSDYNLVFVSFQLHTKHKKSVGCEVDVN